MSLAPIAQKKQSILRKELLKNTSQCLITGWNNPRECECAHIVPKSYGYNIKFPDVNNVSNCCLLSNGLHALFDDMQWTLDIYYFLNQGVSDETSFSAMIVSTDTPSKRSILNNYKKTVITVPLSKYASFMMHYYAYHLYNYTNNNNLGEIYKKLWNSGIYQEVKACKTTSHLKKLLLKMRANANALQPVTCILGKSRNKYRVLWEYYDYSYVTKEPLENIEYTIAYNDYEHLIDPNYGR